MNYRLYGFSVDSEIPLPARPEPQPASGDVLRITYGGAVSVPNRAADGDVLACMQYPDDRGFALTSSGDGYLLRFYGICQFEIAQDVRSVVAFHDHSREAAWLEAFLAANVFGYLLALMGEPSLHASAVAFEEGVIAVTGGSGAGKSTVAALLCGIGGCLVTDDLLRLRLYRGGAAAFTGSRLLRLKGAATELASVFPEVSSLTVDERVAVEFTCDPGSVELGAVISPKPSRTAQELTVRRLSANDAFLALVTSSYLTAWKNPLRPRAHFRHAAEIVRSVPVYSVEIPWGPPFSPQIAKRLRELAGAPAVGPR